MPAFWPRAERITPRTEGTPHSMAQATRPSSVGKACVARCTVRGSGAVRTAWRSEGRARACTPPRRPLTFTRSSAQDPSTHHACPRGEEFPRQAPWGRSPSSTVAGHRAARLDEPSRATLREPYPVSVGFQTLQLALINPLNNVGPYEWLTQPKQRGRDAPSGSTHPCERPLPRYEETAFDLREYEVGTAGFEPTTP
jgi:hypothetical protein